MIFFIYDIYIQYYDIGNIMAILGSVTISLCRNDARPSLLPSSGKRNRWLSRGLPLESEQN